MAIHDSQAVLLTAFTVCNVFVFAATRTVPTNDLARFWDRWVRTMIVFRQDSRVFRQKVTGHDQS